MADEAIMLKDRLAAADADPLFTEVAIEFCTQPHGLDLRRVKAAMREAFMAGRKSARDGRHRL